MLRARRMLHYTTQIEYRKRIGNTAAAPNFVHVGTIVSGMVFTRLLYGNEPEAFAVECQVRSSDCFHPGPFSVFGIRNVSRGLYGSLFSSLLC